MASKASRTVLNTLNTVSRRPILNTSCNRGCSAATTISPFCFRALLRR